MTILRRGENEKWRKISKREYENEAELQEILYNDPSIIPVADISDSHKPIKVAVKEFGLPGAGSSDIVGIDKEGNISIIETKLAGNPEVKREVLGQIIEYAAYLWKKTYEQLNTTVESKEGAPLLDLMGDSVDSDSWSEEGFRREVSQNLQDGEFMLFVIVDEIDDNLKRIIEFINSQSFSGPQIYAVSLGYYEGGGEEMLVPKIYGASIKETEKRESGGRVRIDWSKEKLLEQAKERLAKDRFRLFENLFDFFEEVGRIDFGSGENGNFGLTVEKGSGTTPSVWRVDTNGGVRLGLGWLADRGYVKEKELRSAVNFVKSKSDDFDESREWEHYFPSFDIKRLSDEQAMKDFKKLTRSLAASISVED